MTTATKEELFKQAGFTLPNDIIAYDSGQGRGMDVHARIDPELHSAILTLIDQGHKFHTWPKNKSDYVRNAVVWYTKKLIALEPLQTVEGLSTIRAQLAAWEMSRIAHGDKEFRDYLESGAKELGRFITEQVASEQFNSAREAIRQYAGFLKDLAMGDEDKARLVVAKLKDDVALMKAIGTLDEKGFVVEALEV